MVIGVDVKDLSKVKAGKEWYTYRVLEQLAKIDKSNEYILYGRGVADIPSPLRSKLVRVEKKGFPWHVVVARRLKKDGVDLYWAPTSGIVPVLSSVPSVITIHDLTALLFPGKHTLSTRVTEGVFTKRAIMKAEKVIAISEATKNDIVKHVKVNPKKIEAVPLGITSDYRILAKEKIMPILARHGVSGDYVLFVGTLEPRKNIQSLIWAFANLDDSLKEKYKLVVVGKKGWFYEDIFAQVSNLGVESNVKFLGYVPEEDKPALYNGATVFVFPSFYEGFGLPPLEAMACGAPVITSNTSSLPEVVGDAAITVDPQDKVALRDALRQLLTDNESRDRMSKAGLERSQLYTWEAVAKSTLKIIEQAGRPL